MATKEKSISSSVRGGTITARKGVKGVRYQARFERDGKQVSETFSSEEEAAIFLADNAKKAENNEPIVSSSIKKLTFEKIFTDYIDNNVLFKELDDKGKVKRDGALRIAKRIRDEIGSVPLSKFNAKNLENYIEAKKNSYIKVPEKNKKLHKNFNAEKITISVRKTIEEKLSNGQVRTISKMVDVEYYNKKLSEGSVRKYYYEIKKALMWHAKRHNYAFDNSPFLVVTAPAGWANQKERRLEAGEMEKLIDGCNGLYQNKEQTKLLIKFLVLSCFRVGETFKIKWKDFYDGAKGREKDPSFSYILIPKANQKGSQKKGIKDRKAAMRPELYKLITEELIHYKKSDEELMFPFWPSGPSYFYTRFKAICVRMKIDKLTVHDLRHEAISTLYELYGGRMTDIQISSITGHVELDTLKRYANLRPSSIGNILWSA